MTNRFEDVPALLDGLGRLPSERPALTFYKGKTRAGHWTYGELLASVDRFTCRLRDDLGVRQVPVRLELDAVLTVVQEQP